MNPWGGGGGPGNRRGLVVESSSPAVAGSKLLLTEGAATASLVPFSYPFCSYSSRVSSSSFSGRSSFEQETTKPGVQINECNNFLRLESRTQQQQRSNVAVRFDALHFNGPRVEHLDFAPSQRVAVRVGLDDEDDEQEGQPAPAEPMVGAAAGKKVSDFTIETILSSSPKSLFGSDGEKTATFCPQASSLVYRSLESGRNASASLPSSEQERKKSRRKPANRGPRIPFTGTQLSRLETKFSETHYLSSREVSELSQALELAETRVKIWFQNRRAREKRAPVQAIAAATALEAITATDHHF